MRNTIIIFFLTLVQFTYSQKHSIAGYVEDISTGERIIGAYVLDSLSKEVTFTNDYGFFTLNKVGENAVIKSTYLGFSSEVQPLVLFRDTFLILKISTVRELEEVMVHANQYRGKANTPLGLSIIPVKSLVSIPALGEPDLLKSIQSQAGIKGGIEGSSGIFVRGGGGGENLFLLDDVPMYNVSHLYGFFSAFNSNAVKHIKLLKGCFPARYGGRTSSIIDVRSLDGNSRSLAGELAIGLISSRATLEGPIINDKTTFLISARRSYIDLIAKPFKKIDVVDNSFPDYYFYDLNVRVAHTFSYKDRIYLSVYNGEDNIRNSREYTEITGETERFTEKREEASGWGNLISSLRWNHAFGNSLFTNTTIAYSSYKYFIANQYNSNDVDYQTNESVKKDYLSKYTSDINDVIAKIDFDYTLTNNTLKFGFGNTYHTFNPGINQYSVSDEGINENTDTSFVNKQVCMHEPYCYLEYELRSIENLTVNAGIRQSGYVSGHNKRMNTEPRFSINYMLFSRLAVKAGYSRMYQYLHLLNSYGVSMPTDLWIPALQGVKPLKSDQVNVGLAYNFNKKILLSVEVYQKWLFNTTDYKNGESLATNLSPWYTKITQGTGEAKGVEVSVEKQQGRLKGNVNYTLSIADRKYTDINDMKSFPFKYDRLHDLSISVNYQISEKFDISLLWVYGTGYPATLPVEKYLPALGIYNLSSAYGGEIDYYPSRNNCRLPEYHRLDVGIHYKKQGRKGEHNISFDIFNAYNRKNPVYMYFSGYRTKTLQYTSLLPLIPTITYSLKFNKQK